MFTSILTFKNPTQITIYNLGKNKKKPVSVSLLGWQWYVFCMCWFEFHSIVEFNTMDTQMYMV